MDEPMAGMSADEKGDLARFILDIRDARRIPVVLVEHDMEVVMDISDRVTVIDWGTRDRRRHAREYPQGSKVIRLISARPRMIITAARVDDARNLRRQNLPQLLFDRAPGPPWSRLHARNEAARRLA